MAEASENVGCKVLDEFVDDASLSEPKRADEGIETEPLKAIVQRVANKMAVSQFNLGELVERVMEDVGPQIEERVRRELQEAKDRQESSYNDSFTG
ncbi:MAG: hypothetical protein HY000_38420 [Planctomycetes bacterium]|nr:hypothetical protein [Planctomycetota bacterium]